MAKGRSRLVQQFVVYEDGKIVGELRGLSSQHDVEMTLDGDIRLGMLLLKPGLQIKELLDRTIVLTGRAIRT